MSDGGAAGACIIIESCSAAVSQLEHQHEASRTSCFGVGFREGIWWEEEMRTVSELIMHRVALPPT